MHVLLQSVPPNLHQATTDPHLHGRLLDTHRQVWISLFWGHCSFLLGPGAQGSICALQESISQSRVSSGSLYGRVKGNCLQEGLCHTQICYTQSPCPCGSPLLTRTSTEDVQTLFCLSLCGVPGSWCIQGLLSLFSISGGNGV